MRLHRFFINTNIDKKIRIDDQELLHQWQKVFRLTVGDKIIIFNGGDSEYEAHFELLSKKEAVLIVDRETRIEKQTNIELHIFQSIIKKDNFELIVEKCTEIGATVFHPIISERSEKKDLNIERLNKIAKEAAEQSGKTALPKIINPEFFEKAISNFDGELFAFDFDGESMARSNLANSKKVGLLIGPEGGWSDEEKEIFNNKKIKKVSFGTQILRAETAAIAASALILLNK